MRIHNHRNDEDENDSNTSSDSAFKIYVEVTAREYNVLLSDSISDASDSYYELYHLLSKATSRDVINIHLSNFGGAVHTGLRLAHLIKNCEAPTILSVEGSCYSMGSILALSGDALRIYPGTFLMFHNYSTIESGKAGEVKQAIHEFDNHFIESLEYFCSPFLTKAEMKRLKADGDVYVRASDKDIDDRLSRHFPHMTVVSEEMEIEIEEDDE